jgi:hypothetical protein
MTRRIALLVGAVVLTGCSPGAREAAEFQGNWTSESWGTHLSISGGTAEVFEFTDLHCYPVAAGGVRGIGEVIERDDTRLVLRDSGRLLVFEQIEFLPEECIGPVDGDPASSFDILVRTIESHHAPGVDAAWPERVASLRPDPDADEDALYEAVTALLDPLDHPDVRLAASGRAVWRSVDVESPGLVEGTLSGDGGIVRASLGDGVEYVGFSRLGAFAADAEDSTRIASRAIDDAATASVMVIDLRAADGGAVAEAQAIASRFVPDERVIVRYEANWSGGTVPAGELSVRPLELGTYSGRVFVLIGPATTGPPELLAAALQGLDGVTLVGTTTAGSAAPRMVRRLPNDWAVGLANLVATSSDGSDLTGGVVPDVVADDALQAALDLAG